MSPINTDEEEEVEEQPDDYRLHRNHSFREEKWLKYNRQVVEDDFQIRNKQVSEEQGEGGGRKAMGLCQLLFTWWRHRVSAPSFERM